MADMQLMDYLCKLAKLSFDDPTEKEKMVQDMQGIIALMDRIKTLEIPENEIDFPGSMEDLREDKILPSLPVDQVMQNVPDKKFHFIAVKKLMD